MTKYGLTVYCRLNDVSRDAGPHDQCEANNDEEAIEILRKSAKGLLRYYDHVGCTIFTEPNNIGYPKDTSRIVSKFTLYPESHKIYEGIGLSGCSPKYWPHKWLTKGTSNGLNA